MKHSFFQGFMIIFALMSISCGSGDENESKQGTQITTEKYLMNTTGMIVTGPYDIPALVEFREQKNQHFQEPHSPIPESQRRTFAGLSYFPPNSALAFTVSLVKFPQPEEVKIATSKGDARDMIRYGQFTFLVDTQQCTLTVYTSRSAPGSLFVPFKDATSGVETYEVGRYLDIDEQADGLPYLLDFNMAYNPYCAYNDNYTCPLVPKENVLNVRIEAGEKLGTPKN